MLFANKVFRHIGCIKLTLHHCLQHYLAKESKGLDRLLVLLQCSERFWFAWRFVIIFKTLHVWGACR